MKKIYLYLMLALPFLGGNCASDPNTGQSELQEPVSFTINEAKEFFESIIQTNVNSRIQPYKNILNPGEFTPQWDNAVCSTEGRFHCVQVPIHAQYRFRTIRSEFKDCSAQAYGVDTEQRLVLLKSRATKALSMLIVTLIPDRDYAESNKDRMTGRSLSDTDKERFEGLVLGHSVIRGRLFSVEQYENGLKKEYVYFYDQSETSAEETLAANQMLKNVSILKKANIQTRGDYESSWEVCTCGGYGCAACNGVGEDWGPSQKPKPGDDNYNGGDGGGDGSEYNPGEPTSGDGGKDPTPDSVTDSRPDPPCCASCSCTVYPDPSGHYYCSNCGHDTTI